MVFWVALGLALLTYCGGKTDDSGSSGGGTGGNANGLAGTPANGFGGHTSGCVASGTCGQGNGGFAGDGFAGHTAACIANPGSCPQFGGYAGMGGDTGQGGFSGQTGFGGHTAACLQPPPISCGGGCGCRPGCPCTPECPCLDAGAVRVEAGAEAGVGIVDAAMEARLAEASLMSMSAPTTITPQSCYVLSGYEPDPCLPIDDALLSWLSNVPTGCRTHVTGGPFAGFDDGQGRTCCYSVACE